MAKVYTIKEVLAMEDDMPVQAVRGKLTKLYKRIAGESDKGKYSFENGSLADATGTIAVCFKDRDPLPADFKGRELVILAHHGDKGWTGCKTKDEDYKGKVTRKLWVTKTGEVMLSGAPQAGGDDTHVGDPEPDDRQAPPNPPQQRPAQPATPPPATGKADEGLREARQFVARNLAFCTVALQAAFVKRLEFERVFKTDMGDVTFAALFNGCCYGGSQSGTVDRMPLVVELKPIAGWPPGAAKGGDK